MNFLSNDRLIFIEFWYISSVQIHMVISKLSTQYQNKMQLSLLFVALFGVAAVAAVPTGNVLSRSLSDDWADFRALVDEDAILEVVITYLAEDAEIQALVVYLQSDDLKNLVLDIEAIPEYIKFLNYLNAAGLDIYRLINRIHTWLGLDELTPSTRNSVARITGGVAGFWADIKATLPLTELRALYETKLETSEEFANLIALLSSDEAKTIYSTLKANEEYQYIRQTLASYGLDVDYFFDWLKALIGYA